MSEVKLTNNQVLWVQALESGEFKQAIGVLESSTGNCCLGVACRVAMANGVELSVETNRRDGSILFNKDGGELPWEVAHWLGITLDYFVDDYSSNPSIGERTAISLNDDEKLSFKEIAQRIREHGIR